MRFRMSSAAASDPRARNASAAALKISHASFFLSQPDVDLGQLDPHRHIFRIHFEDLLEKPHRLIKIAILHEVFGDLQILRAGVVEQALLRVEFRQFQRSIHARLELGDLLVHGNALDREALGGIGIAHRLEAFDGFGAVAQDARRDRRSCC